MGQRGPCAGLCHQLGPREPQRSVRRGSRTGDVVKRSFVQERERSLH